MMEFTKAFVSCKFLCLRKEMFYFIFEGRVIVQIFVHWQCRVRVSVYHNSYHRLYKWTESSQVEVTVFLKRIQLHPVNKLFS